MYKLPVFSTIGDGYRFLWGARDAWLNYALGPILLVSLLPTLFGYFVVQNPSFGFPPETGTPGGKFGMGVFFGVVAIVVVMMAVYVVFAVAWHRRYLLGAAATSPREMITWHRRHWVFVGRGFLYAMLSGTVAVLGLLLSIATAGIAQSSSGGAAGIAHALTFFASWLVTIVIVSILLVGPLLAFPAAAVEDYDFRLRTGWRVAKGNRLRMVAVLLLGAAIVPFAVQLLFAMVLAGVGITYVFGFGDTAQTVEPSLSIAFVVELISQAVYFLGIAVGVSLLSIMYRRMRDNVPLTSPGATPSPEESTA